MPASSSHGGGIVAKGDCSDSDNEVPLGSLPSYAPSLTSAGSDDAPAVVGLQPEVVAGVSFLLQPSGEDVDRFTVGCWAPDDQERGRGGTFGVFNGNWGQDWAERRLNDHMIYDLKSTPATIVLVQEVTDTLFSYMQEPGSAVPRSASDNPHGGGDQQGSRPEEAFIGFRGLEPGASLMICARPSIVPGMRLLLFELRNDGWFKPTTKRNKGGQNKVGAKKMAHTRILVVSCKMRFFRFHGGGDELVLMNVHVHRMTAKKEVSEGARAFKQLFDDLVGCIVRHGVRVLAGDFNMAMMQVLPELRARGLQANLASWYAWKHEHEEPIRVDSCAIILIGPVQAVRTVFDCSLLGHAAPAKPWSWRNVAKVIKDERGRDVGAEEIPVEVFCTMGAGFPLDHYRPKSKDFMKMHVQWTFAPALARDSSAMAEIMGSVGNKQLFPFGVNAAMGLASWEWPQMPVSKQKLCHYQKFDPHAAFFNAGAHMPTMIYLGTSSDTRRKPDKIKTRNERAERMGFGQRAKGVQQDIPSHGDGKATSPEANSAWPSPPGHGDGDAAWPKPTSHGHWDDAWTWASWGSDTSWAGSSWESNGRGWSSAGW